jgi:hypothetical protein
MDYRARLGITAASLAALLMLAGTQVPQAAAASSQPYLYAMKRPAITVTVVVAGRRVLFLGVQAKEKCLATPVSGPAKHFELSHGYFGRYGMPRTIHAGGLIDFHRHSRTNERSFAARFSRRGLVGIYRAWNIEETSKYKDRCGTVDPHGRPVHFIARFVGPL